MRYDELARDAMRCVGPGAVFVNTSEVTRQRKHDDPASSNDGLQCAGSGNVGMTWLPARYAW